MIKHFFRHCLKKQCLNVFVKGEKNVEKSDEKKEKTDL